MENSENTSASFSTHDTEICVVGAGPGGAFLSYLLAKEGVNVVLIEKTKNFERSFRGESVSPDARALLERNGFKESFDRNGLVQYSSMSLFENGEKILKFNIDDFSVSPNFITEFPQPVLLKDIVDKANKYPNFKYLDGTVPTKINTSNGAVTGLVVSSKDQTTHINTQLVVAADGRFSSMRKLLGVEADTRKVPRDFLWFTLPRPKNWENGVRIKIIGPKQIVILPTYPDKLRCGVNIPPGGFADLKKGGIDQLKRMIITLEPLLKDVVNENINSFDDVHLLAIFTASISRWAFNGLVFMGDAAHTLSPVMGQGIKYSLFDGYELSKVITKRLKKQRSGIFQASELQGFEAERRKAVDFTAKFQKRQERIFAFHGTLKTFVRRSLYRIINNVPFIKHYIIKRIYLSGMNVS